MTKIQARKIFEKYNPINSVIRCPNGRAPVRKMLDIYAKAAVNLYGIIPINDFTKIFNSQNSMQTNSDEIFTLLLPDIIKRNRTPEGGMYCFYRNCIVHGWAMNSFDAADFWLREQKNKPRYIPDKNEFIKYENIFYQDEVQDLAWKKVLEFLIKELQDSAVFMIWNELKDASQFFGQLDINKLFQNNKFDFISKNQVQKLMDLLSSAHNNTRMWLNNGNTPGELNKKYGQCCHITEQTGTAKLHWSDCTLFYETWYGLMGYINKKEKIIPFEIKPIYPNPINDELIFNVREALWKSPELINSYLAELESGAFFSSQKKEKIALLKSWQDHHIKSSLMVMEYKPEYAVLMNIKKNDECLLYGVTGISRSIAEALQHELPVNIETVLLPFRDKIIYDSYLGSMNISYGKNMKKMFFDLYNRAKKNGIITEL